MKRSLKIGFSFGFPAGAIVAMGVMVGLYSTSLSKLVVIGGLLNLALADALGDAIGIHTSQESEVKRTFIEIWESTLSAWFGKFIFPIIFIIPVLLFELPIAVMISVILGLSALAFLSFFIAKNRGAKPWHAITEHLIAALIAIALTYYVGGWIRTTFG